MFRTVEDVDPYRFGVDYNYARRGAFHMLPKKKGADMESAPTEYGVTVHSAFYITKEMNIHPLFLLVREAQK